MKFMLFVVVLLFFGSCNVDEQNILNQEEVVVEDELEHETPIHRVLNDEKETTKTIVELIE